MNKTNAKPLINQEIIALYDEYTHAPLPRRVFMKRLSAITGSTAAASAVLPFLENNYAMAQTVPATDNRLSTSKVTYPGPGGSLNGYLAMPTGTSGRLPSVIVIHENRGLNAHIEDVARRVALEGFVALAPDYLSAMGGTPADEDKARDMIATLKPADTSAMSLASLAFLKSHPRSTGKVGVMGFCWGGGAANQLAVDAPDLNAAVAYYGMQPKAEDVPRIKAPLLLHYAGLDDRIDAGIPGFESALKASGKTYTIYMYEGANHAFNNDTNAARYDANAAKLSWSRTIEFFKRNLA